MNTLTLQATFCGLLHGLGKLAFRVDKTAADLLADLPDTPEWAAVRGGAAAGSDAARCAAFARSLSVTADTPAAEPASTRYRPLRSIFSHLNGEHPGYSVPAARPDGALHDPVQDAPDIPAAVYRELYQELTGQLTGLQFSPAQANALLGLLESQCSALPASTARDEDRDISLYDQLKLTAALAACVSEYLQQADAFSLLDTPAELRREPAFLLYTADFSRIQRFIYTVHTEGALRSLRSRSFFLELLMEHYMDELLDGCGLTRTNIIYSGGGHCYLLLPNTATVQQTLADWNRAFNGWLNEQFGVQLFLANGWTPCSANDLCNVPAEASPYKALFRRVNAEGLCPWCNRFANLSAQPSKPPRWRTKPKSCPARTVPHCSTPCPTTPIPGMCCRTRCWAKNLPVWSSFLHRSRKRTTITAAIPCCTT